jgi:hypothetical protein
MARYFTNIGPETGPYLYRDARATIDVLEAPDGVQPIGLAACVGSDAAGAALWKLVLGIAWVPGNQIVVDREFKPV